MYGSADAISNTIVVVSIVVIVLLLLAWPRIGAWISGVPYRKPEQRHSFMPEGVRYEEPQATEELEGEERDRRAA